MEPFKAYRKKPITIYAKQMDKPFEVKTLEGTMMGKAGDYLIIGVKVRNILAIKNLGCHTMRLGMATTPLPRN